MFILKKKKTNGNEKSTFPSESKGITESQKKDITKKAHKKAIEIKRKIALQEKGEEKNEKKMNIGLGGAAAGIISIIKGVGGKACGGIFVAPNPLIIGLGVIALAVTIVYLWLGS